MVQVTPIVEKQQQPSAESDEAKTVVQALDIGVGEMPGQEGFVATDTLSETAPDPPKSADSDKFPTDPRSPILTPTTEENADSLASTVPGALDHTVAHGARPAASSASKALALFNSRLAVAEALAPKKLVIRFQVPPKGQMIEGSEAAPSSSAQLSSNGKDGLLHSQSSTPMLKRTPLEFKLDIFKYCDLVALGRLPRVCVQFQEVLRTNPMARMLAGNAGRVRCGRAFWVPDVGKYIDKFLTKWRGSVTKEQRLQLIARELKGTEGSVLDAKWFEDSLAVRHPFAVRPLFRIV
ncbi:hypothetical protein M427DRAFT_30578 [Gonapodya prolifera JEL478]|uniref:F-box domain-containing protein n=1 Tax=Gonapodya prolifera (strain JEL478) TaxID=1344416 RepID=A0A139AKM3_GONPJ|nr:hypothetical protein M427DRAFT_30578 [Gonapodya prolifera JEL478]|eukprot:KXS17084.1 hypothetical protein M427DRAFT_30578 [Gonapodya prolifera JEL478]